MTSVQMRIPTTYSVRTTSNRPQFSNLTKWATRTRVGHSFPWRFIMYSPQAAQFELYVAANLAVIECS